MTGGAGEAVVTTSGRPRRHRGGLPAEEAAV